MMVKLQKKRTGISQKRATFTPNRPLIRSIFDFHRLLPPSAACRPLPGESPSHATAASAAFQTASPLRVAKGSSRSKSRKFSASNFVLSRCAQDAAAPPASRTCARCRGRLHMRHFECNSGHLSELPNWCTDFFAFSEPIAESSW